MGNSNENNKNMNGEDVVLDHNYDGIQEFDNPLPGWWLLTFFGTIIFAGMYYLHYEIAGGPSQATELKADMAQLESMKSNAPKSSEESEDELAALMTKGEVGKKGQEVFAAKCQACHGDKGQGLVGPNLTDNFWIHGKGTRKDIVAVIRKGVPDKGMLAWETMMPKEEVIAVAAHVYSLKGTNPPNPKAPQGEEVK